LWNEGITMFRFRLGSKSRILAGYLFSAVMIGISTQTACAQDRRQNTPGEFEVPISVAAS